MYRPCAAGALVLTLAFPASSGLRLREGRTHVPGSPPRLSAPTGTSHSHIYITVTSSSTSSACVVPPTKIPSPHRTHQRIFWKINKLENLLWRNGQLLSPCAVFNYKNNQVLGQVWCSHGYNKNTAVLRIPVGLSRDKRGRFRLRFRPKRVSFSGWWMWKLCHW